MGEMRNGSGSGTSLIGRSDKWPRFSLESCTEAYDPATSKLQITCCRLVNYTPRMNNPPSTKDGGTCPLVRPNTGTVTPFRSWRGASPRNLGLLMISTVELGVVSLYGIKAHAYVAMDSKGRLYAAVDFNSECEFKERLLPNRYNVYESKAYPGMFIALSKHGRAKRGSKVSPTLRVTHFLPRL